jgi:ParB-like chromosome segregation protein Spo0J/N6-adenosine-specific RNA methylase IME4
MKIRTRKIYVGDNRRKAKDEKVKELASSIKEIGLLNPITVREKNGQYELVAGLHRLKACEYIGIDTIEVTLFDGDDIEAQLAEIDENLRRNDLTILEQSQHLARRDELLKEQGKRATVKNNQYYAGDTVSPPKTTKEMANEIGLSERSAQRRMQVARDILPEVQEAIQDMPVADSTTQLLELARMKPEEQRKIAETLKIASGEMTIPDARREVKKREVVTSLESVEAKAAKALEGVYDVIVIDPPWAMQKIERDVAPEQVAFEYPTMTLEEIADMKIPAADNCHVFLWTTQKFLPNAFALLTQWQFKYVCTFVWHKNGGFQPFGLPQYNCEFAIYARKGTPQFIDFKNFLTCFSANRGKHSEKPEEFYDVVRRVTAGRRLDMFNRRAIEGFDTWGKEAG